VRRVAATDVTLLIEGENGTGKELVAPAAHRNSSRAENPFVAIDCAAIAENLPESEWFGHEKGALTGSGGGRGKNQNGGRRNVVFGQGQRARAGTAGQAAASVARAGIPLDTRLIAATNKKLYAAFEAAEFRKDLHYRLNVLTLTKPAQRDRAEDIPRGTLSVEGHPEVQEEDEGTVGGGEGLPRQIRLAGNCAGARTRGAAGIGQCGLA
jgi:sigma54-dependent transcription regulator